MTLLITFTFFGDLDTKYITSLYHMWRTCTCELWNYENCVVTALLR